MGRFDKQGTTNEIAAQHIKESFRTINVTKKCKDQLDAFINVSSLYSKESTYKIKDIVEIALEEYISKRIQQFPPEAQKTFEKRIGK